VRLVALFLVCGAAFTIGAAKQTLPDTSDVSRGIDLARVHLESYYEPDFSRPLRYVNESSLFENDQRVRTPSPGVEWVLEGGASARVTDGRLSLVNDGGHLVFWSTRKFPADFMLEFEVMPSDANSGLGIVFFAASGRDGGGIFDMNQQKRDGVFNKYHSGQLDAYHASYWANRGPANPRGTAHVRKDHGFHLVAVGRDYISGQGRGPHRVRILKMEGRIEVEVNGKLAVRWQDDGESFGRVLGNGFIGLRQMEHTRESSYGKFRVWKARARE
jgi:Domain of unknown function (DUF1961)